MRPAWLILGSVLAASPAMAQDISLKPLIEARLRYENVDQAGLPKDSEAATIYTTVSVFTPPIASASAPPSGRTSDPANTQPAVQ